MSAGRIFGARRGQQEEHWISVSDMMAGLMVVFLFIAIIYIRPIVEQQKKIRDIAVALREVDLKIYNALYEEFKNDLLSWDAEIEKETLIFRFKASHFRQGSAELPPRYLRILSDFCPRYFRVLDPFQSQIDEVRIEGHTSTEWGKNSTEDEAYFKNMELSQNRTRSVLQYCMGLQHPSHIKNWIRRRVTANGLSSSRIILTEEGRENKAESRRVDVVVETKKDPQIVRIIDTINQEPAR